MLVIIAWILLALGTLGAIRALVVAIRDRTRETANGAVGFGCGLAIFAFVLSLVGLMISFHEVGETSSPSEKTAILSQRISDFVSPNRYVIGLGLLIAFVGGILRGLGREPKDSVDPKTIE